MEPPAKLHLNCCRSLATGSKARQRPLARLSCATDDRFVFATPSVSAQCPTKHDV